MLAAVMTHAPGMRAAQPALSRLVRTQAHAAVIWLKLRVCVSEPTRLSGNSLVSLQPLRLAPAVAAVSMRTLDSGV